LVGKIFQTSVSSASEVFISLKLTEVCHIEQRGVRVDEFEHSTLKNKGVVVLSFSLVIFFEARSSEKMKAWWSLP
jgi:hypothetical protein